MAVDAVAAAEAEAAGAVVAEAVIELPLTQVILRFFLQAEQMTNALTTVLVDSNNDTRHCCCILNGAIFGRSAWSSGR